MDEIKAFAADSLYRVCDPEQFEFETTAQVEPAAQPLGQQRALDAIEFGVDIERQGFNLFVIGNSGFGKDDLVQQVLHGRAGLEDARSDWCYVNNFDLPQQPRMLRLPAGLGQQLRGDMETLVEDLLSALPTAFESEEYRNRRQEIEQDLQDHQEEAFRELASEAEASGIMVVRTPAGYTLGPSKDGHPLDQQEYENLPDDEKQRIEVLVAELQKKLQEVIRDLPLLQREHHQRIKALNEEITRHTVEQLIAWMEDRYRELPAVMEYLGSVTENAIREAEAFLPRQGDSGLEQVATRVREFFQYGINVIVDNTASQGSPIVFEDNPTYQNLIGRVEYASQMGTLITNFTLIKPGALHRANGGYLVLDANQVLRHGYAWQGLKRALKAREIRIQSLEQMLSLANTVSLEPESIPLRIKVILTGEPELYFLLKAYDPEFDELFKVAADFSTTTPRAADTVAGYARLVATLQQQGELRPVERDAVARLVEESSRDAGDAEKLSLHVERLRDLLGEADYWAGRDGRDRIGRADIEQAIEQRDYRQDRYRELMQEQILRGIKLIDTEGTRVAQVNGLSVLQAGGYLFGLTSRITATARLGRGGVIDIEREAKLGGDIHSKGVMILASFLASRYAPDKPLPLAASLAFEQSYGRVDGDSASAAELCALLSALGDIPLKQSLAVTGSINQLGEIQAIGGVNEKIEGFFEICASRGLTGEQGVIVPAVNRLHLMLHRDVRDAVEAGRFHIYPAATVEDVMGLLCGLEAGVGDGIYPEGSFNRRVADRISQLQQSQRQLAREARDAERADSPPEAG